MFFSSVSTPQTVRGDNDQSDLKKPCIFRYLADSILDYRYHSLNEAK